MESFDTGGCDRYMWMGEEGGLGKRIAERETGCSFRDHPYRDSHLVDKTLPSFVRGGGKYNKRVLKE